MNRFRRMLRRFIRHERGVALIEMVAVTPFLILLVLGAVELSRYVLIAQKVNRAGFTLADMLSQEAPPTVQWVLNDCEYTLVEAGMNQTTVNNIMNQFTRIMAPFGDTAKQMVILSSVRKESGRLVIKWQTSGGGTLGTDVRSDVTSAGARGTCCQDSTASFTGDTATQMAGTMDGENFVAGEVFYRYEPLLTAALQRFGFTIQPTTFSRRIYLRPRNGDLLYLPPTYKVPTPPQPALPSSCIPAPPTDSQCCSTSAPSCCVPCDIGTTATLACLLKVLKSCGSLFYNCT